MFAVVLAWEATKEWLSAKLHLTHWDLHVLVGLALFVLFAKTMRRPLTSFAPLVPIGALEMLNEAFDFTRYWVSNWPWEARSTEIEVALTLGPPFVVILVARALSRAEHRNVRSGCEARQESP